MSSVALLKQQQRVYLKAQIRGQDLVTLSQATVDNLRVFLSQFQNSIRRIGAFQPLKDEPKIEPIWSDSPFLWCFPKVEGDHLLYYEAQGFERTKNLGVKEPQGGFLVSLRDIECLLIPGLGFDLQGNRIGRGLGFFDRVLAHFSGLKVGVGFEFQVVEKLERESWDIPIHVLVTETQIRDFRKVV